MNSTFSLENIADSIHFMSLSSLGKEGRKRNGIKGVERNNMGGGNECNLVSWVLFTVIVLNMWEFNARGFG